LTGSLTGAHVYKLMAICRKEFRLLRRDRTGLAMLFLMPVALVLIITLIQNDILERSSPAAIRVMFVNHDAGDLGARMLAGLRRTGEFYLVDTDADGRSGEANMRRAIVAGSVQAGIVIPAQASRYLAGHIDTLLQGKAVNERLKIVSVLFDPGIPPPQQMLVTAEVQRLVQQETVSTMLTMLSARMNPTGSGEEKGGGNLFLALADHTAALGDSLVDRSFTLPVSSQLKPNAVQHNVPAWTMFAIFFISLPLAGGLIREKNDGLLARTRALPVPVSLLFLGKTIAYSVISLLQLLLMLGMGALILPLFGTPVLLFGSHPWLILLVGLCAGVAACGLGILFGMAARSYDQVASAGPILIVIAAAIGGIMIPVFMMPEFIRPLSAFSPLHWGHAAFVDLFLRDADITVIWPNLLRLLGFFLLTGVGSLWLFRRQR